MKRIVKPILILSALGVIVTLIINQPSSGKSISVEEARTLLEKDTSVVVLDVRTPAEYHGNLGHISGSLLIPIQELEGRMHELEPYKDKTIVIICRTDNRSGVARSVLQEQGFKAVNVLGGMVRWNTLGYPVEK